jgi:hypothetical protein
MIQSLLLTAHVAEELRKVPKATYKGGPFAGVESKFGLDSKH